MRTGKPFIVNIMFFLFVFFPSILFASMPTECPSDCPNTGYYFPHGCKPPYGGNNSYSPAPQTNVAMPSISFDPSSPSDSNRGSDAYSRTATIPAAGNSLFQDVSIGKKSLAEKETLLNFGGKGAIPLEINLYYSGMRIDYSDNENGNTHLGPGWALNYEMCLMDIEGSDDMTFRTSTGDLHRLIKIGTNSWKSRWFWIPLTVSMTKVDNDPVYGILYKMVFDDNKTEYGFRQYGQLIRRMRMGICSNSLMIPHTRN